MILHPLQSWWGNTPLSRFDYAALLIYCAVLIGFAWHGMSVLTAGGFLLIAGAWLTYKGKIFWSVIVYFFADICWVIHAVLAQDWQGSFFILAGMLFGLLATWKMYYGEMDKELRGCRKDGD
jgi:O-antigen/teichoic acid export membrane protein